MYLTRREDLQRELCICGGRSYTEDADSKMTITQPPLPTLHRTWLFPSRMALGPTIGLTFIVEIF